MPNPNGHTSNLKHYQPKWNSGKTRTIRVPIALAERILDYAYQIDSNGSPDPRESNLEQIAQAVLSEPAVTRNGKDRGAAKRALNAFIARLKN